MVVMAVDYGDAHTGVAFSDPTGSLTGAVFTVHSRQEEVVLAELARLAREHGAETLVIGLPKNMDGSEGARAALCRAFAEKAGCALGLSPILWDERRTTVDAHRILFDAGKNAKKRKKTVDAVAASLILEGYLEYLRLQHR